ncbi:MAG TPA: hypothetical protein VK994_05955, partial [Bacteroidales bacterium]|nr:hypothetical protein [Bacteroidales bacterium]
MMVLINDKHILRFYQAEIIAFAFLLPIYRKVIPYLIAALLITWLFDGDFALKARRIAGSRNRQYTLLFASLYLIYLVGLLYTRNFTYGLFDIEVKMSLFIFPVVFATIRGELLDGAFAKKVLFAFVFGVFASMLLCYGVALY